MRLLLSWLRDFVDVPVSAEEIAAKLALRGFEVASVEAVPAEIPRAPWQTSDGPDGVIDFEITANRPDCLSVLGLAREVATTYDRPVRLPTTTSRAKPGEMLRTLDGVERKLDADMLVIADANRAQAIAGVMGGAASEVSAATTSVAFESAYFKPTSVRRTSKRLGLKTEASARFERGADISMPVVALQRAVALMELVGAGRASGPIVDRYPAPRSPKTLHLRRDRLTRLL